MGFFTDKSNFTHTASFYGIPVYVNLENDDFVVSGTNIIFDKLFDLAAFFHNTVIEFSVQLLAYLFNWPYQAGFPFKITGEIEK